MSLIQPKYSSDAEKSVLSAMFISEDAVMVGMDLILPEYFYLMQTRKVYNAMRVIYKSGGKIDLVTVSEQLRKDKEYENIGGDDYLLMILDSTVTSVMIKKHIEILERKYKQRQILHWHYGNEDLVKLDEDPKDVIRLIQKSVISIADASVVQKDPTAGVIGQEIEKRWLGMKSGDIRKIPVDQQLFSHISQNPPYIQTPLVSHYEPETIIGIGAPQSNGKSTLMAELSKGVGMNGGGQLCFSCEDTRHGKLLQLIGNMTGIPRGVLRSGELSPEDRKSYDFALEAVKEWPIKFYDNIRTIDEIRLKIMQEKMKGDVDVVFLDYVQKLRGSGSLYERMAYAADVMEEIKTELSVCFVFFSQIDNKTQREGGEFKPLKGAGELTDCPDVVINVKKENQTEIGCERHLSACFSKNRFGPCKTLEWQFTKSWAGIEVRE